LATNKADMQKYREQLREARQTAKEEAEYEGRAWRAEEDAKQAFLGNPREAAMRDVAALEEGVASWMKRYHTWRPHQTLGNRTPQAVYRPAAKAGASEAGGQRKKAA
ncbi:MAG: integrase core domain-containing protein, partial [Roseimicrobium sp.]